MYYNKYLLLFIHLDVYCIQILLLHSSSPCYGAQNGTDITLTSDSAYNLLLSTGRYQEIWFLCKPFEAIISLIVYALMYFRAKCLLKVILLFIPIWNIVVMRKKRDYIFSTL